MAENSDSFENFAEEARKAVAAARQEARRYGHSYMGNEHVLLGLAQQRGAIAATALGSQNVEEHDLRDNFEALVGRGEEAADNPVPNAACKKSMGLALRDAFKRQDGEVNSGHLLLSILRDTKSPAHRIVEATGGRSSYVQRAVESLLRGGGGPGEEDKSGESRDTGDAPAGKASRAKGKGKEPAPAAPEPSKTELPEGADKNSRKTLETYGKNLTAAARAGSLDPVLGRDSEIRRMKRILGRRSKNNPALTGQPGTGKTAVVEGLASEIAEGRVAESLKRKEIYALDLSALVAGSKYRGEFEERMKKVVEEASTDPDVVLFIDEMHTIIGAGSAEGSIDAAQILKPPLSRAEIQLIGATTSDEYRKYVEKDKALERRFQPVDIDEPTLETAVRMLRGLREYYEHHYRVEITESAIDAAVRLSDRYISERYLPDKAIDLLDETCSEARVASTESELADLEKPPERGGSEKPVPASSATETAAAGGRAVEGSGGSDTGDSTPPEGESPEAGEDSKARVAEAEEAAARDKQAVEDAVKRKDFASLGALREKAAASEEAAKNARRTEREGRQDSKDAADTGGGDTQEDVQVDTQEDNLPAIPAEDGSGGRAGADAGDQEVVLYAPPDAEGRYPVAVGEAEIANMVSLLTGVPEGKVSAEASAALASLEAVLHRRVVGQHRAVSAVSRAIRRHGAGFKEEGRPVGSFLFLGPTGTGKTLMAKSLAAHQFGSESAMVRLDMTEYQESHATARLVGAPPGYVGHDEAGQLTEPIRKKPYSVVLFDEIEKAHPDVYNILLQILDDGRLTDASGHTVDFTNTIVIMTSNAGASRLSLTKQLGFRAAQGATRNTGGISADGQASREGATPDDASTVEGAGASGVEEGEGESPDTPDNAAYQQMKRTALSALRELFKPELLNRIDEIVVFHRLGRSHIREILDIELGSLSQRVRRSHPGLSFSFSERALEKLARAGYSPELGARPLKRVLDGAVADPVSEMMVEGRLPEDSCIKVEDNGVSLEGHSEDYFEEPILSFDLADPLASEDPA